MQWMLKSGVMPTLFTLLLDDDERCRVKALLALSCMVRGDAAALEAFRAQHGVAALVSLLTPDTQPPRVQRYVGVEQLPITRITCAQQGAAAAAVCLSRGTS